MTHRILSRTLCLTSLLILSNSTFAQVSAWRENAENGLTYIRDFTSPSYSLIQSSVASEGQSAFHLANANFEDNWFEIDQTISVNAGTNLFFTSQFGAATPEQFAKVQLSTDTGQTWPTDVFSQAGNGFPGESSFSLKSIPLGDYAGADVRLRFMLDFDSPGSAFTQTDVHIGWIIDDIQITSEFEKTPYSFGNPSPEETLYLEYINRSRSDALAEASRLANTTNSDVQSAINFFSIDPAEIENQYAWAVDNGCFDRHAPPLAFNESLVRMAGLHSQDQQENDFQGHVSSNNPPAPFQPGDSMRQRANRLGYPQNSSLGENAFASARDVEHGHAGFEIDWGNLDLPGGACYNPAFTGQGMQNPAGHRANIHSGFLKEVGIGVVPKPNGQHVVTQNFGSTGESRFATGVVYEDANSNGFYDVGEGRGGVRVDAENSPFYAISSASGAYTLPILEDGLTTISFGGAGVSPFESSVTFVGANNAKVDYVIGGQLTLAGDFNNDQLLDVADLDALTAAVRDGANARIFDLNNNGTVDQGDREIWVHDLKNVYFGDSNLDGEFNSGDFVLMFRFGEYEDDIAGNSTWTTGDFNGDGDFDTSDFVFAFRDNGYEKGPRPPVAVPEPTGTITAAAIALTAMLAVRRRRSDLAKHGSPQ